MPYGVFEFKAVKPQALKTAQVRARILNALKSEGKYAESLLNETIATWQHEKPTMTSMISYAGGNVAMIAGPTGNDVGVSKWRWLDQGTRVRYASLSRDWVSKTARGQLRSGHGAGYVIARGFKAGAHRGIEARGWSDLITKRMRKTFHRKIQQAITEGLRARGG